MKPWSHVLTNDVDARAVEAGWHRVHARRNRPRVARTVLPVAALALVAAILLFVVRPFAPHDPGPLHLAGGASLPAAWAGTTTDAVALDDGSRIEVAAASTLRAKATDATHVDLALDRGQATFDVKPGGPRAWSIDAGRVVVRVLGTRFTVQRTADAVDVSVERGRVLVEGARVPGGARLLIAGESIHVDEPPAAPAVTAVVPAPIAAPTAEPAPTAPTAPTASIARRRPTVAAPVPPGGPAIDPMIRADAARRDGRPREALALLTAIVERRERDASLAAFTAAKIHAEDLGDPATAASWFQRATDLGLPAGLDEEALARAVESLAKAGKKSEAARAAARYEARFPNGRHLERVRSWARD